MLATTGTVFIFGQNQLGDASIACHNLKIQETKSRNYLPTLTTQILSAEFQTQESTISRQEIKMLLLDLKEFLDFLVGIKYATKLPPFRLSKFRGRQSEESVQTNMNIYEFLTTIVCIWSTASRALALSDSRKLRIIQPLQDLVNLKLDWVPTTIFKGNLRVIELEIQSIMSVWWWTAKNYRQLQTASRQETKREEQMLLSGATTNLNHSWAWKLLQFLDLPGSASDRLFASELSEFSGLVGTKFFKRIVAPVDSWKDESIKAYIHPRGATYETLLESPPKVWFNGSWRTSVWSFPIWHDKILSKPRLMDHQVIYVLGGGLLNSLYVERLRRSQVKTKRIIQLSCFSTMPTGQWCRVYPAQNILTDGLGGDDDLTAPVPQIISNLHSKITNNTTHTQIAVVDGLALPPHLKTFVTKALTWRFTLRWVIDSKSHYLDLKTKFDTLVKKYSDAVTTLRLNVWQRHGTETPTHMLEYVSNEIKINFKHSSRMMYANYAEFSTAYPDLHKHNHPDLDERLQILSLMGLKQTMLSVMFGPILEKNITWTTNRGDWLVNLNNLQQTTAANWKKQIPLLQRISSFSKVKEPHEINELCMRDSCEVDT